MVTRFLCFLGIVALGLVARPACANVRLAAVFSNHVVLQRDMPVPVWGWADPGETITVLFAGQRKSAVADATGAWSVRLDRLHTDASPQTLTVSGKNTVTVSDVLVGEVWLCSGQSNMTYRMGWGSNFQSAQLAAVNDPDLRIFTVNAATDAKPDPDLQPDGSEVWVSANPNTVEYTFSAVAYYFGAELRRALGPGVPVGLVHSSYGGTPIEAFLSREGFRQDAALESLANVDMADAAANPANPSLPPQYRPGYIFNAMIAPLIPYAIRGVVWYQGENNVSRAYQYRSLLPALIADWRSRWGEKTLPFYIVQLANFMAAAKQPGDSQWAELREAQFLAAMQEPGSGLAVTIDIGDPNNIHPADKQDVGLRLALIALAKTYGRRIEYSGPVYQSYTVEGTAIKLHFSHIGKGLVAKGGEPLQWFQIAGADRKFVWADARIDGSAVVVSSPQAPRPVAVRYAWADDPLGCNLYNSAGLPASPFRTDDWPGITINNH